MHTATAIEMMATAGRAVDDLPERLADAGFTSTEIAARLGERDMRGVLANVAWHSLVYAHTADPPSGPPDVLLRLFVLGMPVPYQQFATHIPAELQETMHALDFVRTVGAFAEGTVSLSPLSGTILVADQLFSNDIPRGGDIEFTAGTVMPPHASTFLLLDNACRPFGARIVDLGCGSGAVGLLIPDTYQEILGIDIDPRAVAYARLNALLNRTTAEYRVGDARSPATERAGADRLLFNSPSGPALDDLGQMTAEEAVRATVTSARELLVSGGRASLFAVLEVTTDRDTTRYQVAEWLGPHVAERRIRLLESPHYSITAEAIRTSTLDGRNALLRGQGSRDALWDYLTERKIREITPAVVEFTIT